MTSITIQGIIQVAVCRDVHIPCNFIEAHIADLEKDWVEHPCKLYKIFYDCCMMQLYLGSQEIVTVGIVCPASLKEGDVGVKVEALDVKTVGLQEVNHLLPEGKQLRRLNHLDKDNSRVETPQAT